MQTRLSNGPIKSINQLYNLKNSREFCSMYLEARGHFNPTTAEPPTLCTCNLPPCYKSIFQKRQRKITRLETKLNREDVRWWALTEYTELQPLLLCQACSPAHVSQSLEPTTVNICETWAEADGRMSTFESLCGFQERRSDGSSQNSLV